MVDGSELPDKAVQAPSAAHEAAASAANKERWVGMIQERRVSASRTGRDPDAGVTEMPARLHRPAVIE